MSMKRRTVLTTGTMAGVGALWTGFSSSWTARFLRDRFAEWGKDLPPAPHRPRPDEWDDNEITMAWLGHATVLINFQGLRILTDPVLFPRIGVDLGVGSLGPLRLVQCARSSRTNCRTSISCSCRTLISIISTRRRSHRCRAARLR